MKMKAVWSAAFVNDLPDAAFAVIGPGGKKDATGRTTPRSLRYLPHHVPTVKDGTDNDSVDLPHLRNAMSRASQMKAPQKTKERAISHLEAHAQELLKSKCLKPEQAGKVKQLIRKMRDSAEAAFDFVANETGVLRFHTEEAGLNRQQMLRSRGLGWRSIAFTRKQIDALCDLTGDDFETLTRKAMDGAPSQIEAICRSYMVPEAWKKLSKAERNLIAIVTPVHITTVVSFTKASSTRWSGIRLLPLAAGQYRTNPVRRAFDAGVKTTLRISTRKGLKHHGDSRILTLAESDPIPFGVPSDSPFDPVWKRLRVWERYKYTCTKAEQEQYEFTLTDVSGNEAGRIVVARDSNGWGLGLWFNSATNITMGSASAPNSDQVQMAAKSIRQYSIPVMKVDEVRRLVTGIVLKPEEPDAQNEIYSQRAIEDTAHDFLANYNRTSKMGRQHNDWTRRADLVESWVLPGPMNIGGRLLKAGTWVVTTRILDDALWSDILSERINGYSIGGAAIGSAVSPDTELL